jgi:hypothetical protein
MLQVGQQRAAVETARTNPTNQFVALAQHDLCGIDWKRRAALDAALFMAALVNWGPFAAEFHQFDCLSQ